MVFLCSKCDALVRVDDVPVGCGVRCPRCGAVHDLRGKGPHDVYALRPPPGGWLPPAPYEPVHVRRAKSSSRWRSELSRGFSLGFGWLAGAVFAVFCCVVAVIVVQRSIGPVSAWWNKQQAQWRQPQQAAGQAAGAEVASGSHAAPTADEPEAPRRTAAVAPEDEQRNGENATDDADKDDRADATAKPRPPQDGFQVLSSRFYFATLGHRPEPVIELHVRNNTDRTIGRMSFCATLTSKDRESALAEDYFGYAIEEGLKPGEEAEWRLLPEVDSAWGRAPRDASELALKVVTIDVEDGSGNEILGWQGAEEPRVPRPRRGSTTPLRTTESVTHWVEPPGRP